MSNTPWIAVYTSDLLASLIDMPANTQHVFLVVMLLIYDDNGAIPYDLERIAHRVRRPKNVVKEILVALNKRDLLQIDNDMISIRRAQRAIEDRANRVDAAHERGVKGAYARWGKTDKKTNNARSNASSMHNHSHNHNHNHNNIYSEERVSAVKKDGETKIAFPQEGRSVKRRGPTPISADFVLTPERRAMALEEGIPASEIDTLFKSFVHHARRDDKRYYDWDEAWRFWVTNGALQRRQRHSKQDTTL